MEDLERVCKKCKINKELKENYLFHSPTGYYGRKCRDCINEEHRLNRPITQGRRENSVFIRQKLCPSCNELKDVNIDNFYKQGGCYSKTCKECTRKNQDIILPSKGYYQDDHIKTCTICKEDRFIIDFYFYKSSGYYASNCKECDGKRKKKQIKEYTKEQRISKAEYSRNYQRRNKEGYLLHAYKKFDFDRHLENNLTKEYLTLQLKIPCSYCGYESTGVDRLDNNLGHIQSNCIPCCRICNTAKMNNFSYNEMLIIGKAIKQVKDNRNQI